MSYILDALERSEHERKQGELPSFRQDQNLLYLRKERKSPWPMLLILVLFLNALVFLYIHFSDSTDNIEGSQSLGVDISEQKTTQPVLTTHSIGTERIAQVDVEAEVETEVSASNQGSLPVMQDDMQQAQSKQSTLVEPKLVAETAVLPSTEKEQTTSVTNTETLNNVEGQHESAKPVVAALELVAPTAEPHEDQFELIEPKSKRLSQSGSVTNSFVSKPQVRVSDVPIDASSNDPLEIARTNDGSVDTPYVDPYADVLFLEELDQHARPKVSKIIFNSHIYSSAPSARRVMINNIYLREGQAFQGMTLLSIGEQYIVFEKNGQQFKIAAMRDWMG